MAKIEPPINGKEFRVIHYYKTGTFSTANIPNLATLMQFISVLQSCKQGQRVELIPEDLPQQCRDIRLIYVTVSVCTAILQRS